MRLLFTNGDGVDARSMHVLALALESRPAIVGDLTSEIRIESQPAVRP